MLAASADLPQASQVGVFPAVPAGRHPDHGRTAPGAARDVLEAPDAPADEHRLGALLGLARLVGLALALLRADARRQRGLGAVEGLLVDERADVEPSAQDPADRRHGPALARLQRHLLRGEPVGDLPQRCAGDHHRPRLPDDRAPGRVRHQVAILPAHLDHHARRHVAARPAALAAHVLQHGDDAFADLLALELVDGRQERQEHPAHRGAGVDPIVHAGEGDPALLHQLDQLEELPSVADQTVELVDDDPADRSGLDHGEQALRPGPFVQRFETLAPPAFQRRRGVTVVADHLGDGMPVGLRKRPAAGLLRLEARTGLRLVVC
ncbi:MAG TPA: hypothetical protein VEL07_19450 [Planctomycetota bacterium]|nr:hypothetical protein [Planctomycetota bacterium]